MDATALVDHALEEARAPLAPRSHPLSVDDLLALWWGDEFSKECWHPQLVYAVCKLVKPENADLLRSRFFPKLAKAECPEGAVKMIEGCWQVWDDQRRRLPA